MNAYQNEKQVQKILTLNKNTLSMVTRYFMIICVLKIIYSFAYHSQIYRALLIFLVIASFDMKINKSKTFEEFDTCLIIILGAIELIFISTALVPLFNDNIFSLQANTKAFYKICILPLLLINGIFNLESRGIKILYISYLASLSIIVLLLLLKHEFNEVVDEFLIFCLVIYISAVNLISKLIYFETFKKLLIKNKINLDRYENIIDNLKSSFISINLTNYKITYNCSFKSIVESIDSLKYYEGFYETEIESLKLFYENDYKTERFRQFLDKNNLLDIYENRYIDNISDKKSLKIIKFFKQLYYLIKILQFLQDKDNQNIDISSLFNCENFKKGQKFSCLGNFILANKLTKENQYFEFMYRKSDVSGIEHIDIMLNDNTQIISIEQERADTKYRKSYLSNVAHEFKAPIQILMITVNELSKLNFPKEAEELFRDIDNLGNFILILIMDIISFSQEKKIEVKFDRFNSSSPFLFAIQVLQLLIKNNHNKCLSINTELIIDSNLPKFIISDENRIKQVLVNLITNAYKFTMSGKIVIRVTLNASNTLYDEILVNIEDTGIGIKPEDKDKLFKQSIKLNDSEVNRDGTGLGLSICKNIIDRIGIKIGYLQRETAGSIFFFSFLSFKSSDIYEQIEQGQILNVSSYINTINNIHTDIRIRNSSYKIFNCDDYLDDNSNIKIPKRLGIFCNKKHETVNHKIISWSYGLSKAALDIVNIKDDPCKKYKTNVNIAHLESENCFELQNRLSIKNRKNSDKNIIVDNKAKLNLDVLEPINESISLPEEVYDFYKIKDSDSLFQSKKRISNYEILNCPDCPDCKNAKMFYELFELVNKNSKHDNFGKIYHNFKPYIKFLIQSLRNIDKKVINTCIVDDNSMVLKSLKKMIKGISNNKGGTFEVIKAYDGIEALALFKIDYYVNKSFKYVISDQNMTMMNGLETLAIIKKCLRNENYLKLFVSTSDDAYLKEKKIDYLEFLTKPVSKKELGKLYV